LKETLKNRDYIFFVANRYDLVDEKNKNECKNRIYDQIKAISPKTFENVDKLVHFISIKERFEKKGKQDFEKLLKFLKELIYEKRIESKLNPAQCQLNNLIKEINSFIMEVDRNINNDQNEIKEENIELEKKEHHINENIESINKNIKNIENKMADEKNNYENVNYVIPGTVGVLSGIAATVGTINCIVAEIAIAPVAIPITGAFIIGK